MELKELGEASISTDSQSSPQSSSGGSASQSENQETVQLVVDISQANSIANPRAIHLGKTIRPDDTRSKIQISLD